MKKTLTLVLALVLALTISVSAFAEVSRSTTAAPDTWDLEFNVRKADAAKVVKDGKIGDNEYDPIEFNAKNCFATYRAHKDGDNESANEANFKAVQATMQDLMNSIKFYASWDETNGFNFAVQYHVEEYVNDFFNPSWEYFIAGPAGGIIFQCFPGATGEDVGKNIFYQALAYQTEDNEFLNCIYQHDLVPDYPTNFADIADKYAWGFDEASKIVTIEASYPINLVSVDGKNIYFNLGICRGEARQGDGDETDRNLVIVNMGNWGFYVDQSVILVNNRKATIAHVVDEAVGFVPEPTPTPTPEIKEVIKEVEVTKEVPVTSTTSIVIMIVEAVAIVALAAFALLKKKA